MTQSTKADEQKVNMQEKILNSAEDLFANSSYSATRISDIAIKAGVNQALVHYYFSTKEKLYEAVLERLFRQWETLLEKQSWENIDPELVLRQYIQTHFEIKCKVPNLYKIFHKETLDGGKLFDQYASSQWVKDFHDKSEMFRGWRQAGIINPLANEQVILFCLWGMMNQFYYRDVESLTMITGHSGSKEQLHEEIVDQMVKLAQHGLLVSGQTKEETNSERVRQIQVLYIPSHHDESSESEDDLTIILDTINNWRSCSVHVYRSFEEWQQQQQSNDLLFIVTATKYGEISNEMMKWLDYVQYFSSLIADRYVAIWTSKERLVSDALQRNLEDGVNRLGGFAISRVTNHTIHGYLNRCAKMSGI